MTREEKIQALAEVATQVKSCRACLLWQGTTNGVPGEGETQARLMFIGEGPGFNEDRLGRPFVGQAGKLLDQLLGTIDVRRQDVFITNVVKHRPANNRDPLPIEIETCRRYLDDQITILEPQIIVTLGRFSMAKFLPGEYISRVHGLPREINFAGKKIIVMPMYHPAAALRNSAIMLQLRQDFLRISELKEKLTEKKSESQQLSLLA